MKLFLLSLVFLFTSSLSFSQNAGVNTDGSLPETGVMLDVKGKNSIGSNGAENIFQIKSFDASTTALKLRLGLNTGASLYGTIDVYDATSAVNRALILQPSGGNVGIGATNPAAKLEVDGSSGSTLRIVDGNQGNNKILASDATGQASWKSLSSIPGSCMQNMYAQYIAGSYTFTTSSGTTQIYVELWGGGGGGTNNPGNITYNGGGGGGGYAAAFIPVTPNTNYVVVVGGGGTSPCCGGSGTAGSASTFNTNVLVANGGSPGVNSISAAAGGSGSSTLTAGTYIMMKGGSADQTVYYEDTHVAPSGAVNARHIGSGGKGAGLDGGSGGGPTTAGTSGSFPGGGGSAFGGGAAGAVIIRW